MNKPSNQTKGISAATARRIEYSIIALCMVSLALIFQPFELSLFTIGAGLVVVAGLAFNLVPFCVAGTPARTLVKVSLIIVLLLFFIAGLAIGAAYLYGIYLQSS